MTTDLDGTVIDLDRAQEALDGTRWLWTFELGDSGQPLMARLGQPGETVPLDYLIRWHGALTPVPQPTTAAMYRHVLEAA
ncbi:phiSA1p31-related protein [Streptomyces sp. NPDC003832]